MLAAGAPLDAFDDANLALTTCAYSAFRAADGQDQSLDQFTQMLAYRCGGQMSRLRGLAVELNMSGKGMSRSSAEQAADSVIADFRASFASQYSRREETREQLRALERAIQERGE
jgi:hypothetical protein